MLQSRLPKYLMCYQFVLRRKYAADAGIRPPAERYQPFNAYRRRGQVLRHKSYCSCPFAPAQGRNIPAVCHDTSGVRRIGTDGFQQCGFSAAVLSQYDAYFTSVNAKGHIFHHILPAQPDADIIELYHS